MTNNEVTLSGKMASAFEFSHELFGEGFYRAFISVIRTSGTVDTIPLIISERLVDVSNDYTNENVCICGQYRTYNKQEENKNTLVINVFVTEFNLEDDPSDINEVFLDGFICRKPTFRETPLGRQISDFIIAVHRNYGKSDYIPCICWGRNALFMSGLHVGDHIQLSGRIQSREYVKLLDGIEHIRTAYEVSVMNLEQIE